MTEERDNPYAPPEGAAEASRSSSQRQNFRTIRIAFLAITLAVAFGLFLYKLYEVRQFPTRSSIQDASLVPPGRTAQP